MIESETVNLEDEVKPPKTKKVPSSQKLSAADRKLRDSLQSYYASTGMLLHAYGFARGDSRFLASAEIVVEKSEAIADSWLKLASQNPQVKRALQVFVETSAVAEIVGLHVACFTPFLIGAIPTDLAAGLAAAAAAQAQEEPPRGNGNSPI